MSIDWGSVPDWLAGGGAVLALLWARRAARAATEANRGQAKQLATIEADRERGQASRVAAWYGIIHHDDGDSPERTGLFFKNTSEVPVYAVVGYLLHPAYPADTAHAIEIKEPFVLPPTSQPLVRPILGNAHDGDNDLVDVGLLFRDANDRYWHRNVDGVLVEISYQQYEDVHTSLLAGFEGVRDLSNRFDRLP